LSETAKNSNAIAAWQKGASGTGIKIGFVDTGLNSQLSEFSGRIDPASRDLAGNRPMGDDYGHGTAVASIAAGARNGSGILGIAHNSTILMLRVDQPGTCPSACDFESSDIAAGIDAARVAGARVINLSFGGDDSSNILDAVRRATAAGIIVVVAAGNQGSSAPTKLAAALASLAPNQVIIVGALGQGVEWNTNYNEISSISNRAGPFSHSYLAAPGHLIHAVLNTGQIDFISGTSFSAPVVAGAVALIAEAFPTLSSKQILQLLFMTADDLGSPGADVIYGNGRLNIGRAFQPVGTITLAGSTVVVSSFQNGTTPTAAGDAAAKGDLDAIILDDFGRAFGINLARTLTRPHEDLPLSRLGWGQSTSSVTHLGPFAIAMTSRSSHQLDRDVHGEVRNGATILSATATATLRPGSAIAFQWRGSAKAVEDFLSNAPRKPSLVTKDVVADHGFIPFHQRAFGVRQNLGKLALMTSYESGEVWNGHLVRSRARYRAASVSLEKRTGNSSYSVRYTRLHEGETVLGGSFASLFGRRGSSTSFLDVSASVHAGHGWTIGGDFRRGWTKFAAGSMRTTAYALQLSKNRVWSLDDQLVLRVSRPLAVDSGGMLMTLPVDYDYFRQLPSYDRRQMSLVPSVKEIAVEGGYSRMIGHANFNVNLFGRLHPNHFSDAKPDVGAAFRAKLNF
jgi:hypothetical protein